MHMIDLKKTIVMCISPPIEGRLKAFSFKFSSWSMKVVIHRDYVQM
jgi:hypothetical protein